VAARRGNSTSPQALLNPPPQLGDLFAKRRLVFHSDGQVESGVSHKISADDAERVEVPVPA